jgi:demethylmenaquinone methyltransferase/2-methoxy-6-polyprenyl-1,4-benzoquinol methylase
MAPEKNEIGKMFSSIARWYDFLNHLLSFNLDRKWRKEVMRMVNSSKSLTVLDVCTGTGDIAIGLKSLEHKVFGIDISGEMLRFAMRKAEKKKLTDGLFLVRGDALFLPFKEETFDLVTIGFGLRNFTSCEKGISEMVRILKKGGRLLILEFSMPSGGIFSSLYSIYLRNILPFIGGLISGSRDAYRYLSSSIQGFMKKEEVIELLKKSGLQNVGSKELTGGIAVIYHGIKF